MRYTVYAVQTLHRGIKMQITRTSPFTGITRTMEIPITNEELARYERGDIIQHCFPILTPSQREFIKTGIVDEEWPGEGGDDEQ